MKCPKCDGTGKAEIGVGAFTIHGADCDQCNGKGIIEPMTNEEWRRTCSTEEFAEWLGDKLDYCQVMWYWACDKCTWSKKHESCLNDKEKWLEWLKQPHGGES